MHAYQWEFTGMDGSGLSMSAAAANNGKHKHRRGQRQSGLAVLYTAVRRLPVCSAVSAGLIWLAARLLPEDIRWTVGIWSGGLLALALATGTAALSWALNRWQLTDHRLTISSGVLTRREVTIHRSAILSADVETTPFTALFRCSRLYIRTAQRGQRSGRHHTDRLLMSTRDAVMLSGRLLPRDNDRTNADDTPEGRCHSFRADRASLLLAAAGGEGLAAFCSAAASALSLLRDSAGAVLGEQLTVLHTQSITSSAVIAAAAGLLAGTWVLKGAHTLLTHAGMGYALSGGLLVLSRGVISRRSERLRTAGVGALDMRLSLPSALTGRQSCALLMTGGQRCELLPPVDRRRLRIEAAAILPRGRRVCVVSPMTSPLLYAWTRWAACLSVLPLTSLLRRLIPSWTTTILAAGVTAAALLLWRALTTTLCAPRAGLTLYTDCMELTGVHRLTIHTLRISRPSVGMLRITQSPVSRAVGKCTLRAVPRGGNKGSSLSCIKLPFERTLAACERLM